MAAPIIKNYKDQSIIYFENDRAEDVFVLRSGRVVLTYTPIDSKNEVKEDVKVGEFFGVKSAIGHFPREETAQVIGSASVLAFKLSDFEAFVSERTHLIIKMMKVFSSNLRQYHSKVREQLGQLGDAKSPAYELVNVAEVFYKNGQIEHAIYGFEKYLAHYPGGPYTPRVKELLNLANRGVQYPDNMPELTYEKEKKSVPVASSIAESGASPNDIFQQAQANYNAGNYSAAVPQLKTIVSNSAMSETVREDATLMLGIAQKNSKDPDSAFVTISGFIKNFPRSPKVKEAMFVLAEIAESKNEIAKAQAIYNKILSLPGADEITERVKQKINSLKG